MDVREKLIEICFREFCDLAGDGPFGCDGCPYGEYEPDNGGCYVEYKKDKIKKLENDMDKYQKEDNGVTAQEWISVEDRLPENDDIVMVIASGKVGNITLVNAFELATFSLDEGWILEMWPEWEDPKVTYWMPLPQPPKGE